MYGILDSDYMLPFRKLYSRASVNGDAQDDALLKIAGSSPVLTTCFGGRLLLIHRNLHNGESVELDFFSQVAEW